MSTFLIQFLTGLASAASLFMVAAGLSIIFGVSRIVNFAHGSFYMLGAYLAYSLGQRFGSSGLGFWSAVVLAALLVGISRIYLVQHFLKDIYLGSILGVLAALLMYFLQYRMDAPWMGRRLYLLQKPERKAKA